MPITGVRLGYRHFSLLGCNSRRIWSNNRYSNTFARSANCRFSTSPHYYSQQQNDYYKILGVSKKATSKEIRDAFLLVSIYDYPCCVFDTSVRLKRWTSFLFLTCWYFSWLNTLWPNEVADYSKFASYAIHFCVIKQVNSENGIHWYLFYLWYHRTYIIRFCSPIIIKSHMKVIIVI